MKARIYEKRHDIPGEFIFEDEGYIFEKGKWYEFFFTTAVSDPRRLSICCKTGDIYKGSFIDADDEATLSHYEKDKGKDTWGWSAAKTASVDWHTVVGQREVTIKDYPEVFI